MASRKIALLSQGQFVCAESDPLILTANRDVLGPWETLLENDNDDGTVSLVTNHGYFVCAENGGGGEVKANRTNRGPWESFTRLTQLTGPYAVYKCFDGRHYLGAAQDGRIEAIRELPFPFERRVIDASDDHDDPRLAGGQISAQGPRLYVTRNGITSPWFGKGASFFRGFEKFCESGQDAIRPQLDQLASLGANCVDVWCMYHYLRVNDLGQPAWNMATTPANYDKVGPFHDLLDEYGMHSVWVAICDPALVMPKENDQIDHWNKLDDRFSHITNIATVILNNEHDAHGFNQVNRSAFMRPSRHLGMCSSWTEWADDYATPQWDVFGYHHPRYWHKVVKDAVTVDYPGRVKFNKPVWLDEPVRIDAKLAGQREQDPRVIEQMAYAAASDAAGIVFHSQNGKHADLYDDYTMERARAFFGAVRHV